MLVICNDEGLWQQPEAHFYWNPVGILYSPSTVSLSDVQETQWSFKLTLTQRTSKLLSPCLSRDGQPFLSLLTEAKPAPWTEPPPLPSPLPSVSHLPQERRGRIKCWGQKRAPLPSPANKGNRLVMISPAKGENTGKAVEKRNLLDNWDEAIYLSSTKHPLSFQSHQMLLADSTLRAELYPKKNFSGRLEMHFLINLMVNYWILLCSFGWPKWQMVDFKCKEALAGCFISPALRTLKDKVASEGIQFPSWSWCNSGAF